MCLQTSAVTPWHGRNWEGDQIVHEPIIPASRTIPGTRRRYPIDIREFLTTTNNAVVNQKLGRLIDRLPPSDQARFRSRSRGSFDFRADAVLDYVGTLRYLRAANKAGRVRMHGFTLMKRSLKAVATAKIWRFCWQPCCWQPASAAIASASPWAPCKSSWPTARGRNTTIAG
jgi:hypothetical protein